MIISDIKTRVKRAFGDESGVQITDDDIKRWINDGQREIVMNNEGLLEKTATANIITDTQSYNLPVDLLILKAIHFKGSSDTAYRPLRGMTFTEFNEYIDGWDGATSVVGTPVSYTIHAGKIYLFPVPDSDISSALKIYYQRSPTDIVNDGDTPDLPLLYHSVLVNYCLRQAHEMDEDLEAAAFKDTKIATDLALLKGRDDWSKQETYPVITVLSDDAW